MTTDTNTECPNCQAPVAEEEVETVKRAVSGFLTTDQVRDLEAVAYVGGRRAGDAPGWAGPPDRTGCTECGGETRHARDCPIGGRREENR